MIRAKQIAENIVIDLTGPEGNAFCLEEMKSGNYENLVATFDKYFGDYVILER
jgi:hypothetical protein